MIFHRNASKWILQHYSVLNVSILQFFPVKHTFPCCSLGIVKTPKKGKTSHEEWSNLYQKWCLLLLSFEHFCLSSLGKISHFLWSFLLFLFHAALGCHPYCPHHRSWQVIQVWSVILPSSWPHTDPVGGTWPKLGQLESFPGIFIWNWGQLAQTQKCWVFVKFLMEDDKEWSFSIAV